VIYHQQDLVYWRDSGWYYGDWLWNLRGFIDKLYGGVGPEEEETTRYTFWGCFGFWSVLYANKKRGKTNLFAEMKLQVKPARTNLKYKYFVPSGDFQTQRNLGKLYWYSVLPFHGFIFEGMLKEIDYRAKYPFLHLLENTN
jgi:hypothetical protein